MTLPTHSVGRLGERSDADLGCETGFFQNLTTRADSEDICPSKSSEGRSGS